MTSNSSGVAFAGVVILVLGMLAGAFLRGAPAAELQAGGVRYDDQHFVDVYSDDELMIDSGSFVGPVDSFGNATPFCIDFFATSTATAVKMTASSTATIEGTDGVMVMQYGSCS